MSICSFKCTGYIVNFGQFINIFLELKRKYMTNISFDGPNTRKNSPYYTNLNLTREKDYCNYYFFMSDINIKLPLLQASLSLCSPSSFFLFSSWSPLLFTPLHLLIFFFYSLCFIHFPFATLLHHHHYSFLLSNLSFSSFSFVFAVDTMSN